MKSLTLLMIGDSLTHASAYPAEVLRLLSEHDHLQVELLGTHRPPNAPPGVAHEGYGGWTWERFNTHYDPDAAEPPHRATSPFVFAAPNEKPALDVPRYFEESCAGKTPDIVTFFLGINDCAHADANHEIALDEHIDGVLAQADILLEAFRVALPHAYFGLLLTPPPNAREAAFKANYGKDILRRNWLKIRQRLNEKSYAHFAKREGIFLVPLETIDPQLGYPEDNALHPNELGYHQIARDVYDWITTRLEGNSL